jgi:hypothetical protein
LYEISEVRKFVPVLVAALPELFFFVYTGERGSTLKVMALCLTDVKRLSPTPDHRNRIQLEAETDKIGRFLESHFSGLNEMTEWLSMPAEENMRILFEVARAMGFDPPPYDAQPSAQADGPASGGSAA